MFILRAIMNYLMSHMSSISMVLKQSSFRASLADSVQHYGQHTVYSLFKVSEVHEDLICGQYPRLLD